MDHKTRQFAELFFENAAKAPMAVAMIYFEKPSEKWVEITWAEYARRVRKLAAWLLEQGVSRGDRVVIQSGNRPEWLITDLAILAVGAVSVPIYHTAAEKDLRFILQHSGAKAAFLDDGCLAKRTIDTPLPSILVTFDNQGSSSATYFGNILVGKTVPVVAATPMDDSDVATIVYTSGTTGEPKGVIHTHGAIMAAIKAVEAVVGEGRGGDDRFFSFLPLSHVAERVLVEIGSVAMSSQVVFARSTDSIVDDMCLYPPTILLCVPRVWERIHEKIVKGVAAASLIRRCVFAVAAYAGASRFLGDRMIKSRDGLMGAKIADLLVGKKLREKLGMQRVRLFVTGSAPTRPDVLRFFGVFGIFIREVYGLTENLCLGVVTGADEIFIGKCGRVFPGNEVKIAADGEILFRAVWNFKGYYKNDAATQAVYLGDWLATGDLGQIDSTGRLSISGRKKELLKTSTGKYIAPVPIEEALKALPMIVEAMVVGDNEKYCVAIVALDATLGNDKEIEIELRKHLAKVNVSLAHHESIKRLGILKQGFSIEEGTLTPTLKVKRAVVAQKYRDFIKRVYSSDEPLLRE